jgi:hypothetical protein
MPSLHAAIPFAIDRFDFEKVQKVMEFLGWTWSGNGKSPTIDELKGTAFYLLSGCVHEFETRGRPKEGMLYATGGFQARVECFEKSDPRLELLFYVDTASSTGEY